MVKLEYPWDGSVDNSVELENPTIGNSLTYRHQINSKRSMTNVIYTYVRGPVQIAQSLNFIELPKSQADDLIAFCKAVKGDFFKYTDYDDDEWKVKLINNPVEVSTDVRGNYASVNIEIEGTKI